LKAINIVRLVDEISEHQEEVTVLKTGTGELSDLSNPLSDDDDVW
jgi:hypothetical protein